MGQRSRKRGRRQKPAVAVASRRPSRSEQKDAAVRANNVLGGAISIVVVVAGGYLFFKLVRVLSRIQMPKYPGRD